jgi:[protein-PII] uridylyltransferase
MDASLVSSAVRPVMPGPEPEPNHLERLSSKLLPELKTYIARHRAAVEQSIVGGGVTGGLDASHCHSKMVDGLLCSLFHAAIAATGQSKARIALGAVGSYGRRTLSLHSDIDVHFVTAADGAPVRSLVEALLYPLWDAGLSVGHQIVVPKQVIGLAKTDLPTATALLDFRWVAGDKVLGDQLTELATKGPFAPRAVGRFLEQLTGSIAERHERFGDSVFLLEPDVKNGAGGLRDLDAVLWMGRARWRVGNLQDLVKEGALVGPEVEDLLAAGAFLVGIRNRLHLHARRRADRLVFEQQERGRGKVHERVLSPCASRGAGAAQPVRSRAFGFDPPPADSAAAGRFAPGWGKSEFQ